MPNFLWKRLQNHKHTSLFYLIVNWISLGFELLVRFKEEWHLINLWALWNWQLSHLVDTNAAVLCFGSWGENPTKWQSLWISSKPHSHNSFNEAFGEKEKEMSACGCACPCMCETQKVKAGEREGGEKGGTVEAADAGNEKLVVVKWREGEGGSMCESLGTDAGPASPQPISAWHKHPTPRLQPPSNSLTMAQTAWQRSKALPLNHIKVSLALHWKII